MGREGEVGSEREVGREGQVKSEGQVGSEEVTWKQRRCTLVEVHRQDARSLSANPCLLGVVPDPPNAVAI